MPALVVLRSEMLYPFFNAPEADARTVTGGISSGVNPAYSSYQVDDFRAYNRDDFHTRTLNTCRVGSGTLLADILDPSLPVERLQIMIGDELPRVPESQVYLTPRVTSHPLIGGVAQRSVFDGRSFSLPVVAQDLNAGRSHLVVKGGDPFHREGTGNAVERIPLGQAPGFSKDRNELRSFRAAALLHELSLEQSGNLASIPIPHSVRRIDEVPVDGEGLVPVQEYMNSGDYLRLGPLERLALGIPQGAKLGDYLMRDKGVVPAEQLYFINGPTLRCSELLNLLIFDGREEFPRRDPLRIDFTNPPSGRSLASPFGERLLLDVPSQDGIIRGVYAMLGAAWDVPLQSVLPHETIDRDSYARYFPQIRVRMSAMAPAVLEPMAHNIMDTLALAHSQGLSLSRKDARSARLSGAAHPTNVTIGGVICDLEDVSVYGDNTRPIEKDFAEAVLTLAVVSRAISYRTPKPFLSNGFYGQLGLVVSELTELYLSYVEQHTVGDSHTREIISKAAVNNHLRPRMKLLFD